jgi:UDP-N-acetylmuramoylalanine--D-glutamate ligase
VRNEIEKFKSFSIIGAARSGVAAAKLLKAKGYKVFLSDSTSEEKIKPEFLDEIKRYDIEAEFGKHSGRVFESDAIVVSPGVPQNSEVIMKSKAKGLEVLSEIEVASWFCKGKIISVTGTNGKTTTTTLIGEIFKDAGFKTLVCGNIGTAFSEVAEQADENTVAVVETSSFQLDNIKYFKPFISIILNITPDHLNRYNNSFGEYTASKMNVTMNQDENDYLVFNYDDEVIKKSLNDSIRAKQSAFSLLPGAEEEYQTGAYLSSSRKLVYFYYLGEENIIDAQNLIIKGQHNIYNSLASIITAKVFGIKKDYVAKTLSEFKGVEHRLEFVREINGIKFYNDSKATNVNSVWYALQGFDEPIVLILGGQDKGNDYTEIENEVKKYVKHIIAIGESKEKIYSFFKEMVPVTKADSMEDAVYAAARNANKNEVVLLSPACASFDMFENYEQRGKEFKRIVNKM